MAFVPQPKSWFKLKSHDKLLLKQDTVFCESREYSVGEPVQEPVWSEVQYIARTAC